MIYRGMEIEGWNGVKDEGMYMDVAEYISFYVPLMARSCSITLYRGIWN